MVSKVNLKARINRHSRIIKDNFSGIHPLRALYYKWNYFWVLFMVVILMPVYPLFSWFFYTNTVYDFNRSEIDESSILESFSQDSDSSWNISMDNYLQIWTTNQWQRDVSQFNEIIEYEVKPGDSFSSIASRYQIRSDSIYWANNFSSNKVLQPWEIIKIPPVSWLLHEVKSWDTLSDLAKKYKIKEEDIRRQNRIESDSDIKVWDYLILPWAEKIVPPAPRPVVNNNRWTQSSSQIVNTQWTYQLRWRQPQRTFYWWNCTWYVAQYKNVTWWWNANQWLRNARAAGVPTWNQPRLWAIVQLEWRWYNPRYWHVWIVTWIESNHIIVSDMNYRRLNEVTTRRIPINDRTIQGYIYVD